jgi:hypothetical protein
MLAMDGKEATFRAAAYTLTFLPDRPFVRLTDPEGRLLAELFILSGVHSVAGLEGTAAVAGWERSDAEGCTTFALAARSSVWTRKSYRFHCYPHRFTYEVMVEGEGAITEVSYFGGYSSAIPRWGTGSFSSGTAFAAGFNPEPSTVATNLFDPAGNAVIDLIGAPLPGMRHWFFNPTPFCFAFEACGRWLGLGVEAEPGEHSFEEYRYHGGEGFHLSLRYGAGQSVRGRYTLPAIGVDFGQDAYEVLEGHVRAWRESHPAPTSTRGAAWWGRPMFCGWGAQCALSAADHGYRPEGPDRIDASAFLASMRFAPGYARQDVYERFLHELGSHDLCPETVVIDDKWQRTYGENEADDRKWSDLAGFIAARHAQGQRVLLWLKAWDREGVPDDECIRNAADVPLAVDPSSPAFERRLRASVHRMVAPDGYGADGFKIDFTHRVPVGPGLRMHEPAHGLELMRRYLAIVHDAAKEAKSDALIVTHTPHPYLADLVDMVRLNDMLDLTALDDPAAGREIERTVRMRAGVARIACPEALIDTDNWPVRDRAAWREYVRLQPDVGVPSLYFTTHIDLTGEQLEADDYELIREAWACRESR